MVDTSVSRNIIDSGTGYASPMEAFRHGPREKVLYVACPSPDNTTRPDCLVTIDADPLSSKYSTIIHTLPMPYLGDELHHMGWNACSSCHSQSCHENKRRFLVLPGVNSSRIYIIDTVEDRKPKIHKVIEPEEVLRHGIGFPHTVHCLADGKVMISMLGRNDGEAAGGFLMLDQQFNVIGRWNKDEESKMDFGYDFWYQPRQNVMVSSEWGTPNKFIKGFNPADVPQHYGKSLYFWDWKEKKLLKKENLGEGALPLEIRFLHNPDSSHGFVNCALSSSIYHFYKDQSNGEWKTEKVIQLDPVKVDGWSMEEMPSLMTDILISMNDKYLYFGNWLHGDVRQYDITDPHHPKLTGQVLVGGSIRKGGPVTLHEGGGEPNAVPKVKGVEFQGGPQMIQLSLDGKRLYVTSSLISTWDRQFYPDMTKNGSQMIQIDVNTDNGGLKINENFLIDFGKAEGGPLLAHETRYPGGDCTSDIWI